MAKRKITLKPIVELIKKTRKELAKARTFAEDKKAIDTRITALDKTERILAASCKGGSGGLSGPKAPPLSLFVN